MGNVSIKTSPTGAALEQILDNWLDSVWMDIARTATGRRVRRPLWAGFSEHLKKKRRKKRRKLSSTVILLRKIMLRTISKITMAGKRSLMPGSFIRTKRDPEDRTNMLL